jgi:hypothetical protein
MRRAIGSVEHFTWMNVADLQKHKPEVLADGSIIEIRVQ